MDQPHALTASRLVRPHGSKRFISAYLRKMLGFCEMDVARSVPSDDGAHDRHDVKLIPVVDLDDSNTWRVLGGFLCNLKSFMLICINFT